MTKRKYTAQKLIDEANEFRARVRRRQKVSRKGKSLFFPCGWLFDDDDLIELAEMLEAGAKAMARKMK